MSAQVDGGEKWLERFLDLPQPFICEGWVSGLFSKPITDRGGSNKPWTSPNSTRSCPSNLALHAKSSSRAAPDD
jgi:hypothetical protein